MIRIGFDPILEAEQQHRELLREVEQYRLANEGLTETQTKVSVGFKFLALIGKEIATLGASIEARYGDKVQAQSAVRQPVTPEECD